MEMIGANPGRKIVVYFLLAILIGAGLLRLPVSSANPDTAAISTIDALFTATSAVCVTGLVVRDTGHDFSLFGQIVILILIQLGGIGIMTFATALLLMAGARITLHDRLGIAGSFSSGTGVRSGSLLLAVFLLTIMIEAAGAFLLFFKFRTHLPFGDAVFFAIFHAVSAFCNAGFSPISNSLENYQHDPSILLIFSALIILGGLGFTVMSDLIERIVNRRSRLSLHTKICLSVTGFLIVGGTILLLIAEYNNALRSFGPIDTATNAFFQAVTCRTAGFNALPQRGLTEVSILISMILMFIGACPGSTGGGVKTTTFAVVLLTVYSRFRGRRSVAVFRRSISNDSIIRAVTVILLAFLFIVVLFALLMFSSERPVQHLLSHGWFVDNLFEMISAFGTVGLSLGITAQLTGLGKLLVIITMFVGRVGLLTLAFALARKRERGEVVYAEEPVMIG